MFWVIADQFEHVICRILYYIFAEGEGVGSSLKAPKKKGERDGRTTFSGCL